MKYDLDRSRQTAALKAKICGMKGTFYLKTYIFKVIKLLKKKKNLNLKRKNF